MLTGFPFGHGGNHTDSFFVQIGIYASYYFYIYDAAVFVDNELYYYAPLGSGLLCNSRVFYTLTQILHQTHAIIRKLGILLYNFKNLILYRNLFIYGWR